MTKIGRSDALRSLSALYRTAGSRSSPDELDIGAPLTLVHDVSEMAAGLSTLAGVTSVTDATAIAGTPTFGNIDPKNILNGFGESRVTNMGISLTSHDAWIVDVSAQVSEGDEGNFANLALGLYPPDDPLFAGVTSELYSGLIRFWDQSFGFNLETAGSWRPLWWEQTNVADGGFLRLPKRFGLLQYRLADGGAGTCQVNMNLHVAFIPKGFSPAL